MSAAQKGRVILPEWTAKTAVRRKARDDLRESQRTHLECKEHGFILLLDCHRRTHKSGRIRYSCKECDNRRAFQYYERRSKEIM
jgi:hypothetical protein